jgi:hypothetical protein
MAIAGVRGRPFAFAFGAFPKRSWSEVAGSSDRLAGGGVYRECLCLLRREGELRQAKRLYLAVVVIVRVTRA